MANANPWKLPSLPHATRVHRRSSLPPVHLELVDIDEVVQVVNEVRLSYERQLHWKPLKGMNHKLIDAVRWFCDRNEYVPYPMLTVVAQALGVDREVDLRDRASFCAYFEGYEWAAGRRPKVPELAQKYGVSERTINYWRGLYNYGRWRHAALRFRNARRVRGDGVLEPLEVSFPAVRTAGADRLPKELSGFAARKAVFDLVAKASREHKPLDELLLSALAEAFRLSPDQK